MNLFRMGSSRFAFLMHKPVKIKYGAVALRETYTRYYNAVPHFYTIFCIIKLNATVPNGLRGK